MILIALFVLATVAFTLYCRRHYWRRADAMLLFGSLPLSASAVLSATLGLLPATDVYWSLILYGLSGLASCLALASDRNLCCDPFICMAQWISTNQKSENHEASDIAVNNRVLVWVLRLYLLIMAGYMGYFVAAVSAV